MVPKEMAKSITINNLVEVISKGNKTKVEYEPERPGDVRDSLADLSLAQRKINYNPTVNLEKGVEIMLEHIDDWHDAPLWDSSGIENATKSWFKYLGKESEVTLND